MKRVGLFLFLISTPVYAADIKPTFTTEQAQTVLNMANAEMERAVAKGNYQTLKQVLPIVDEILRAAQQAATAAPAGEAK
jgi:ribosomal protein L12E/L44/L45/RPP1/RPP2